MKSMLFAIPFLFSMNFHSGEVVREVAAEILEEPVIWHEEYQMIAHAMGMVDGYAETNSLEAFYASYDKGIRVFEGDFQLTSDQVLVLRHDFESSSYYTLGQSDAKDFMWMNLQQFLQTPIQKKYTPLTAQDLMWLLVEYEDAFFVTDTKDLDEDIIREQFTQLVDCIANTGDDSLYERIIVQIYYEEMYDLVADIYPFDHWIFTLYQLYDPDMYEIGRICAEKGIDVVTMPQSSARLEKSEILDSFGLKVYTHTVNKSYEVRYGINSGVSGFYTDSLLPQDFFQS